MSWGSDRVFFFFFSFYKLYGCSCVTRRNKEVICVSLDQPSFSSVLSVAAEA